MKSKSNFTEIELNQLMGERAAADVLCYTVRALQNWRYRGGGPRYIKVSARSVRYRRSDLLAWIDARTIANSGQAVQNV